MKIKVLKNFTIDGETKVYEAGHTHKKYPWIGSGQVFEDAESGEEIRILDPQYKRLIREGFIKEEEIPDPTDWRRERERERARERNRW